MGVPDFINGQSALITMYKKLSGLNLQIKKQKSSKYTSLVSQGY